MPSLKFHPIVIKQETQAQCAADETRTKGCFHGPLSPGLRSVRLSLQHVICDNRPVFSHPPPEPREGLSRRWLPQGGRGGLPPRPPHPRGVCHLEHVPSCCRVPTWHRLLSAESCWEASINTSSHPNKRCRWVPRAFEGVPCAGESSMWGRGWGHPRDSLSSRHPVDSPPCCGGR